MSKIGIYSDVHISRSSSILPLYKNENNIHTLRIENCINSMNDMYKTFRQNNVNMIVNCGDTFNAHTLVAEEISAFFEIDREINENLILEQTIIGNHDRFNNTFSSVDTANLLDQICVIRDYKYIDVENVDLYFISYFEPKVFNEKIDEMLNKYPRKNKKAILFMHGDIDGSLLYGNLRIDSQISKTKLIDNFDIVINGHIHCKEILYNKNNKLIINIGSLTTHGFADSNLHVGHFAILDTSTNNIEYFDAKDQVLFRTYNVLSKADINKLVENLESEHFEKIVKIKCKYEFKDVISEICQNEKYKILKYKLIFIYDNIKNASDVKIMISKDIKNDDILITDKFLNFIKSEELLKYPYEQYEAIIKGEK